jgi:hypothetical protein
VSYLGARSAQLQDLTRRSTELDTERARLNRWKGDLETWVRDTEADFAERERKLGHGGDDDPPPGGKPPKPGDANPPTPNGNGGITREDVQALLGDSLRRVEQPFIQYVADAATYATRHLKDFGEGLDVGAIVSHPKIADLGFSGVYNLVHQDKIEAKAKKEAEAVREAIRKEEREKLLKEMTPVGGGPEPPYPIGSPLDVLRETPEARNARGDTVSRAVAAYHQLTHGG